MLGVATSCSRQGLNLLSLSCALWNKAKLATLALILSRAASSKQASMFRLVRLAQSERSNSTGVHIKMDEVREQCRALVSLHPLFWSRLGSHGNTQTIPVEKGVGKIAPDFFVSPLSTWNLFTWSQDYCRLLWVKCFTSCLTPFEDTSTHMLTIKQSAASGLLSRNRNAIYMTYTCRRF